MEIVWIIIGFVAVNVAWLVGLRALLVDQEEERDRNATAALEERRELMRERTSLLDRIQNREPAPLFFDPNPPAPPEPAETELGLVGTVVPDVPPEPGDE